MKKKMSFNIVDENQNPWKIIIMLAWPILVEQILVSLVHTIDTAMVGSLGKVATASVAISSSPNMLINGVIMAMGVGFTSLVARSVGSKDFVRARSLLRQAIVMVLLIGIPLSILSFALARQIPIWMGGAPEILDTAEAYNRVIAFALVFRGMTMVLTAIYRGYGDSKTPMTANSLVNIINVIGNYLLIFPTRTITVFGVSFTMIGAGWGVIGAGIATTFSTIVGTLLLIIICFTRKSEMQISLKDSFKLDFEELKTVFTISFPAMMERFAMSSASVVVASTVASLGTVAVAAQNLAGTAESLSFMPGFAFGTAATTLFGQCVGAKKPELAKKYVDNTVKLGSVVMAFMTVVLFTQSKLIMSFFTPDLEVIEMGSVLIKILALIQIPQMIAMVYSGALKGGGDTKSPFFVALISMWGVRILGILIAVHVFHLGITAICVCMCTDNVTRYLLFRYIYKKEKWAKKLNLA